MTMPIRWPLLSDRTLRDALRSRIGLQLRDRVPRFVSEYFYVSRILRCV
jgi:hypothetical protein